VVAAQIDAEINARNDLYWTPPSATGRRRFVAGRRCVLRHSQRSSTREQRGNNRETFQGSHDHPPKRRLTGDLNTDENRPFQLAMVWFAVST
jgi:hypothetical protein